MTQSKLLIILLFGALATSCNQYSVVGTWRRADVQKYYPHSDSTQNSIGDLTISSDSTFFIKGIDKLDTSNIPGWHTGGDIKGTWNKPDKNHIILLPNNMDKKFESLFNYNIITLDDKNLIIVSVFDANKKNAITLRFVRR